MRNRAGMVWRGLAALAAAISLVAAYPALAAGQGTTEQAWEKVAFDPGWEYASFSQIHSGEAVLYHAFVPNGYTVTVNAGHGTEGGDGYQTLSHPDGTAKVTGGSNAEGAVYSTAISVGTTMLDGTPEAVVTLSLAKLVKEGLLAKGFDVLMVREGEDVQLDNIARTVFANNCSDAHIALHYDSTQANKGFFYISVPEISSYRSMEPVASHYLEHERLGQALLAGAIGQGLPIFGDGTMALDLTQTSYSTVPSVDVEVGDQASDYGYLSQLAIAKAIVAGVCSFFSVSG